MFKKFRLIILPSIDNEFNSLIFREFTNLLEDIKREALRCKTSGEQSFYKKTAGVIRSRNYPPDFVTYWNANKPYFAKWLDLDNNGISRMVYRLIRGVLFEYQEVIGHAEFFMGEWTEPGHEQECHQLSERLKHLRDVEKVIPYEAHEQDFDIISDCIVYCNHFLEDGILYLITNDDCCYRTAKIMNDPAVGKGSIVDNQRFDCIKPKTFLDRLKTMDANS